MKTNKRPLLTTLVLGISAWTMTMAAQDAGGPAPENEGPPPGFGPGPHRRPPLPPIIAALDANGDGIIDADEIANAPAALKALDRNGDGKLTADELRPQPPPGPGGFGGRPGRGEAGLDREGPPPPRDDAGPRPDNQPGGPDGNGRPRPPLPPIIATLDLNGDGVIDADEIAKASDSLKKLDKNGDGKLTPDELHPSRPGRGGPHFRGGPEQQRP